MRWVAVAALAAALMAAASAPARACDPYWDWCGDDWYDPYWDLPAYEEPSWTWWWDEPVYVPAPIYVPEPVYDPVSAYVPPSVYEPVAMVAPPVYVAAPAPAPVPPPPPAPTWSDPVVWSAPGADVLDAWAAPAPPPAPPVVVAPDPDAAAAALGLHRVTEVWTGHTTMTDGLLTTYASTSASLNAGTRARLVATVGTGQTTTYDPILIGGRTTLSDGRVVSGEIYENYMWNGYEWVVNGYVFFQDDSELARLTQIPTTPPTPATLPPATVPAAPPPVAAAPVTSVPSAPASVTPLIGDIPVAPATASPPAGTSRPVPSVVRAGIALGPQADPLGRVEVLRGRRVPLWVRATVDGVPARVAGWRLVSGEVTALGSISGGGDEPLVATWRTITAPGTALEIRLRASVDVPGEGLREVDAAIDVVVRAPALVE